MNEDKRFYTFVFAPTASSPLRKLTIHHNVLQVILGFAVVGFLTVAFGAYKLTQHAVLAAKLNLIQDENRKLRDENQVVKNNVDRIQSRLAAMQDTSRKLAEVSGVSKPINLDANIGSGGPDLVQIEQAADSLESQLRQIKEVIDKEQIKLASTPNGWPVRGYITDGFGYRANPFGGGGSEVHAGLDLATAAGTPIEATADGIVIFAAYHGGYGNIVVVDHGYGVTTRYGHMSRIDVGVGQHVTRGKQIGAVGSTGRSTAPHCHYEVRLHDRPVNPINYISMGRS